MKRWLALIVAGMIGVSMMNYAGAGRPVASSIRDDDRNKPVTIAAHYQYYVVPSTLVLRLSTKDDVRSIDIWRSFFAAAEAMYNRGSRFDKVLLTRGLTHEFTIDGADFFELGDSVHADENPIYLLRTIPPKLQRPDGTHPFVAGGGSLFELGEEIGQSTEMATTWAGVK
jgi:hypothetical protein